MKISVITPTVRVEGLRVVAKALREQTFQDFEWLISSPNTIPILEEVFGGVADYTDKFPMRVVVEPTKTGFVNEVFIYKDPPKPIGAFWTLNRAYNQMIKQAKGDLIVSWQDFTYATPEALAKFWYYFTHDYGHALISGTGHKYDDDTWKEVVWEDPRRRMDQGTFYTCVWTDVEWNFCSCPKKALYAIGGFDEGMDMLGLTDQFVLVGSWRYRKIPSSCKIIKRYSLVTR